MNFFDWLWFVFYLKCDEFDYKLNLYTFVGESVRQDDELNKRLNKLYKYRKKAHDVDMALTE